MVVWSSQVKKYTWRNLSNSVEFTMIIIISCTFVFTHRLPSSILVWPFWVISIGSFYGFKKSRRGLLLEKSHCVTHLIVLEVVICARGVKKYQNYY